jgi:hypothetical protein
MAMSENCAQGRPYPEVYSPRTAGQRAQARERLGELQRLALPTPRRP